MVNLRSAEVKKTRPPVNHILHVKGGYLDFSHLTELKNIYITEIYMRKQYKSSKIKNKKNSKLFFSFFLMGVPLKGYVASKVIFRSGARNIKQYCGNIK